MIQFSAGRELAATIPGARFVPIESRNHVILEHEPVWPQDVETIRRFLDSEASSFPVVERGSESTAVERAAIDIVTKYPRTSRVGLGGRCDR